MPHYLHQVAYSPEGWRALIAQPQDQMKLSAPPSRSWGARSKVPGSRLATTTS